MRCTSTTCSAVSLEFAQSIAAMSAHTEQRLSVKRITNVAKVNRKEGRNQDLNQNQRHDLHQTFTG